MVKRVPIVCNDAGQNLAKDHLSSGGSLFLGRLSVCRLPQYTDFAIDGYTASPVINPG